MTHRKVMSVANKKRTAKYILLIYFLAVGSFQLGRIGFVPLDVGHWLSDTNRSAATQKLVNGHHVCPAQLFARTAENTGVVTTRIFVPVSYTLIGVQESKARHNAPVARHTSRAPPRP